MAITANIQLFGLTLNGVYIRVGGVSGGKQSGYWHADVQRFPDGGVAVRAYDAAVAANTAAQAAMQAAPGDAAFARAADVASQTLAKAEADVQSAMLTTSSDYVTVPYDAANPNPYPALYSVLKAQYPGAADC